MCVYVARAVVAYGVVPSRLDNSQPEYKCMPNPKHMGRRQSTSLG